MKVEFDLKKYEKKIRADKNNYFYTFLNRATLAAGLLILQPGEKDTQIPHESDEIYYVIWGDGFLKINKKDYLVTPGKAFFVAKNIEHYFHSNTKELGVLYFFGGPDS